MWGNDSVPSGKTLRGIRHLNLFIKILKQSMIMIAFLIFALSPEERSKKLYDAVDILERKGIAESKKLTSNNDLKCLRVILITQLMFFGI